MERIFPNFSFQVNFICIEKTEGRQQRRNAKCSRKSEQLNKNAKVCRDSDVFHERTDNKFKIFEFD